MRHESLAFVFVAAALVSGGCMTTHTNRAKPAEQSPPEPQGDEQRAANLAAEPEEAELDKVALSSQCVTGSKDGVCLPDPEFVKRLCGGHHPDIALAMFAKDSPWTRAYIRARHLQAWNATGAATEKVDLEFDEEVLLLRQRSADYGGMVVSGASGGYDALRWDGLCVSLDGEEITKRLPPRAKNSEIPWKRLDRPVQDTLLEDAKIMAAYKVRHHECRGVSMGTLSKKCVKANKKLTTAVVRYIRSGGRVPAPKALGAVEDLD